MLAKLLLTVLLLISLNVNSQTCTGPIVTSGADLVIRLGSAGPGDVICVSGNIDLNGIYLPIEIPSGVILQGNYDLLSEPNSAGSTFPNGTILSSTHRTNLTISTVENLCVFKMNSGTSSLPTTIRNIRLKGPSPNWIDYSNNITSSNFHSAGIYLNNAGTGGGFVISHCEIFGFSYAGIFGEPGTTDIHINHCYIHHIKGFCEPGIGYANWFQNNGILSEVFLDNNIYDDCKEAIDGQSGSQNWFINNCTLTQFFYGGIARHNGRVSLEHPASTDISCQFYNRSANSMEPAGVPWNIYDVAGGNSTLSGVISHFKLAEDGSRGGLCGFPYPYSIPLTTLNYYTPFNCSSSPTVLATSSVNNSTSNFSGTLNDGGWTNIPLGFSFNFFGTTYTDCNISTNGFLQFGPTFDYASTGEIIPNSAAPNNFVSMCMTDLDFTSTGTIQYCITGTAPNRIFQVEWNDGRHSNVLVDGYVTGHLKLFESSDIIEIQIYRQTINDVSSLPNIFKVAGVENQSGSGLAALNFFDWNAGSSSLAYHFERAQAYDITLTGNTITAPHASTSFYTNNYGGYATIADNYVESCPWNGDPHIKFNTSTGAPNDNSFDYSSGNAVVPGCPQPPECRITLKNISNVTLPVTNINTQFTPNGYNYIASGSPVKIEVAPGTLGSQNNCYIIHTNPDHGISVANNTSGNNYFYDDLFVLGPGQNSLSQVYSLYDGTKPGLHGIDALAIAATNSNSPLWSQYNASSWQHIPLISVPTYGDPHLICHIKDSYYEQYTATGTIPFPTTGVLKTVELNGHRIWEEDIALGGDGWERIDIPLYNNPLVNPEWLVPSAKGKNLLSFSINFAPGAVVDTGIVKGVSVSIDDVYINRFDNANGTNLIVDGDIENERCGTLPTILQQCSGISCRDNCSWFIQDKNTSGYPVVCNSIQAFSNEEEYSYDDDEISNPPPTPGPYKCDGYLSGRDRKSGLTSISLNLPRLYRTSCATYNIPAISSQPPNGTLPIDIPFTSSFFPGVMSAFTQFEYPHCGAFEKDLEDEFTTPLTAVSGIISPDNYNLNKSITIDAGATLEFNNSTLSIGPGVSITVPSNSTLILNASTLNACSDMWTGIINNGTLIIDNSTIEDALNAVTTSAGNQIQITGAIFDHNYTSLKIENGNFNSSTIRSSIFRCSGGYSLKAPYLGQRTLNQIRISNADVTIGDPTYISNDFSGSDVGIQMESLFSNGVNLYNNYFHNFDINTQNSNPSGMAIYANKMKFTLGSFGSGRSNNFYDNYLGVLFSSCSAPTIEYNNFDNNAGGIFGVFNFGATMEINHNAMSNMMQGITMIWNPKSNINIRENTIQNVISSTFLGSGISVGESDFFGSNNGTYLWRNVIHSEGNYGIYLNNLAHSKFIENRVYLDHSTVNSSDIAIGIRVDNSDNNDLSCNEVDNKASTDPGNKYGISVYDYFKQTMESNTTNGTAFGIQLISNCEGSYYLANTIQNHTEDGLLIGDVNNYVNTYVEPLVTYNSELPGNQWLNNLWDTHNYFQPIIPQLFTKNGPGFPDYPSNNTAIGGPYINPQQQSGINLHPPLTCNIPVVEVGTENERIFNVVIAEQIASSQLPTFSQDIVSEWKAKTALYQSLKEDPSQIGNSTILSQFYNATSNGNIGKLTDIKQFLKDSQDSIVQNDSVLKANLEQNAKSLNDGLIPEILPELNEKIVTDVYLNTVARNNFHFESQYVSDLLSVGLQCIYEGGPAVLKARNLLHSQYPFLLFNDYDLCNNTSFRKSGNKPTSPLESPTDLFVYPNPATNQISCLFNKGTLIEITDLTGRVVAIEKIRENSLTLSINISDLAQGAYLVILKDEIGILKQTKLNVVR